MGLAIVTSSCEVEKVFSQIRNLGTMDCIYDLAAPLRTISQDESQDWDCYANSIVQKLAIG